MISQWECITKHIEAIFQKPSFTIKALLNILIILMKVDV